MRISDQTNQTVIKNIVLINLTIDDCFQRGHSPSEFESLGLLIVNSYCRIDQIKYTRCPLNLKKKFFLTIQDICSFQTNILDVIYIHIMTYVIKRKICKKNYTRKLKRRSYTLMTFLLLQFSIAYLCTVYLMVFFYICFECKCFPNESYF